VTLLGRDELDELGLGHAALAVHSKVPRLVHFLLDVNPRRR
jgi:hypothetical protein